MEDEDVAAQAHQPAEDVGGVEGDDTSAQHHHNRRVLYDVVDLSPKDRWIYDEEQEEVRLGTIFCFFFKQRRKFFLYSF